MESAAQDAKKETAVFNGNVKEVETDPATQTEQCRRPVIDATGGFTITAGFETALACDLLVASKNAKFMDTRVGQSGSSSNKSSSGSEQVEQCPQCNAKFSSVTSLVDHVERVHERTGVLKVTLDVCPKCSRGFRDPVSLVEHLERDHGGTSKA
ncbi:unnamed protein product [Ilex paraguariensis]|uniref:C2H2-type domain-containing protein n=1 Tax=Ilex paraguariensis TaxID=185542 RepID=A0ABC8QZZ2_9AQUA